MNKKKRRIFLTLLILVAFTCLVMTVLSLFGPAIGPVFEVGCCMP